MKNEFLEYRQIVQLDDHKLVSSNFFIFSRTLIFIFRVKKNTTNFSLQSD